MTEYVRGTRFIKKALVKNKFSLSFNKTKEFSLNIQRANIPGIAVPSVNTDNPFINRPIYGTKPEYEDLIIEFIVDDVLNSWGMIHDWMRSFAPSEMTFEELDERITVDRPRFDSYRKDLPDIEDLQYEGNVIPDGTLFDDAVLIVNNSGNIQELQLTFKDIFPTALSSIPLDVTAESDDLVLCTASFKYWYYTLGRKGEI